MNFFQSLKNLKNIYPLMCALKHQSLEDLTFSRKADFLTDRTLHSTDKGISSESYGDSEVIVSLTTFGRRLYRVYLTVESLMQQSMPANKIILWISEEYLNKPLPRTLQMQIKRGLEIRYCKDIGPYTKLIPSLRSFPHATIITVDDDLIYDYDLLENLIIPHIADPSSIFANRIHLMKKSNDGKLESYMDWQWSAPYTGKADTLNFLTGVGGVLYPPHSLDPEVSNESVFEDICKYADDVWFTAMAIKAGTPIIKAQTFNIKGEGYIDNNFVQETGLHHRNTNPLHCQNDVQIEAVFKKYNLYDKL